MKTVAIIGAGPSGLVSAKEALDNGLVPTVFEKQSCIGGVWNYYASSTWDTLITNTSKFSTSFGNTDWAADTKSDMFCSTKSFYEYLQGYTEKWKLQESIKFQCTVTKVAPIESKSPPEEKEDRGAKGWEISWTAEDGKDAVGVTESQKFDGVIIATGILAKPFIPKDIKGIETFPGKVIHSQEYKTGSIFEGQRVLVVGGSFSGVEIAGDVSTHTSSTIHCFRNPFWILERYLPDPSRNNKVLPIDLVIFQNRKFYKELPPGIPESSLIQGGNEYFMSFCHKQQEFEDLKISSEAFNKPIKMVISDKYLNTAQAGKVIPRRQKILEVQGSKVTLESGEAHDVDCIILATGFNVGGSSIFTQDVLDTTRFDQSDGLLPFVLFKATLHPDLANMYFVGMYRNPVSSVMEQQARWACRLLSGKVALPPREIIIEGLQQEKSLKDKRPRPQLPHGDFFNLSDEIAKLSKSFPDLDKLGSEEFTLAKAFGTPLKDLSSLESKKAEIFNMFMTQPVNPEHYNLVGDPEETFKQMEVLEQAVNSIEMDIKVEVE